MKKFPNFSYEKRVWKKGFKFVAGADEVGRGAFAGPVVAAAVVWPSRNGRTLEALEKIGQIGINDSKKLSAKKREELAGFIKKNCHAWGVGEASVATINKLGIVKATQIAFRKALQKCGTVDFLLVDAFYVRYARGLRRKNQLAIIKGDGKSISIASASIVAKVYRDNLMVTLGKKHKDYAWHKNAGYGTKEHQEAIKKHGLTRLHRKMFVRKLI